MAISQAVAVLERDIELITAKAEQCHRRVGQELEFRKGLTGDIEDIRSRIQQKDREIFDKENEVKLARKVIRQIKNSFTCQNQPTNEDSTKFTASSVSFDRRSTKEVFFSDDTYFDEDEAMYFEQSKNSDVPQIASRKKVWDWLKHKEFQDTATLNPREMRLSLNLSKMKTATPNGGDTSSLQQCESADGSGKTGKRGCSLETSCQQPGKRSCPDDGNNEHIVSPKIVNSGVKLRVALTRTSNLEKMTKIIVNLGGFVVENVTKDTVLIAKEFTCTIKVLMALAGGVPIVSPHWLTESQKAGHFLDPWEHLLKDTKAEYKYCFQLETSLRKAKTNPLLKGYSILASKNVKPPPRKLKGIITSCSGKFIEWSPEKKWPPVKKWPEKTVPILIGAQEDATDIKSLKNKPFVVRSKWILRGLLTQTLQHKKYQFVL